MNLFKSFINRTESNPIKIVVTFIIGDSVFAIPGVGVQVVEAQDHLFSLVDLADCKKQTAVFAATHTDISYLWDS